jgi:hypothetical protein
VGDLGGGKRGRRYTGAPLERQPAFLTGTHRFTPRAQNLSRYEWSLIGFLKPLPTIQRVRSAITQAVLINLWLRYERAARGQVFVFPTYLL